MPPITEFSKSRLSSKITRNIGTYFRGTMIFLLIVQMAACGTLLYPERKGQQSGKIDPGVVALDAAGLFLFIIPGVVAFAVDYATGAIYLPPGTQTSPLFDDLKKSEIKKDETTGYFTVVRIDPKNLDEAEIETVLAAYFGKQISLSHPDVSVSKVKDERELIHEYEAWVLNDAIFHHVSY